MFYFVNCVCFGNWWGLAHHCLPFISCPLGLSRAFETSEENGLVWAVVARLALCPKQLS